MSDGRKPEISIVVPTLNEEKRLEDALESLRSQFTSKTYEIIVADGYSEDKTVEIAESLADKVVFEKKRTISAGRQAGARAAEGKVIVSAGADIYVGPHWLDSLTKPIFNKTHVASIGPVVPSDGNLAEELFAHGFLKPTAHFLSKLGVHHAIADNMAIDADVFKRTGGFNPDLVTCEDLDLIARAKAHGKIAFVPEAHAYVSMRRVREWGYPKYLHFHTTNFLKYHFKGKPNEKYEPVR
ncbi:MAG: glycosyltransferase [Candidatus Bilamarchaeaceae archaeon]